MTHSPLTIRLATESDLEALFEHLLRHGSEGNPKDGDFIFSPVEEPEQQDLSSFKEDLGRQFSLSPQEVGWARCWIALDGERVVGELKLRSLQIPLKTCLHRSLLQMGIEKNYRGIGVGSQLMRVALDWAASVSTLDWVDLYVFGQNVPALALYSKFGFEVAGRIPDFFRVYGEKIEDVSMILSLEKFAKNSGKKAGLYP